MDDAGKGHDRRPYIKKTFDKRFDNIDFSKKEKPKGENNGKEKEEK